MGTAGMWQKQVTGRNWKQQAEEVVYQEIKLMYPTVETCDLGELAARWTTKVACAQKKGTVSKKSMLEQLVRKKRIKRGREEREREERWKKRGVERELS